MKSPFSSVGPKRTGFLSGIFVVLGLVLIFAYVKSGSSLALSNATQNHGILESATITAVHQHAGPASSGGARDHTSTIDVKLSHPVSGATTSVVHYDDYAIRVPGDVVQVKVNTSTPSYSEYPGSPIGTATGRNALLVGAGVMWIIAFLVGLATRKKVMRKRLGEMPTTGEYPFPQSGNL